MTKSNHKPLDGTREARSPAITPAEEMRLSKLDRITALLSQDEGATIAEMVAVTGWQKHSIRGAMAGTLKKRGLIIQSKIVEGVRRYLAEKPA